MVYHFGVGLWLSEHMGLEFRNVGDKEIAPPLGVGFSGSSGGSLVSCVLGAGISVRDVFEYILEQHSDCRRNPTHMFSAVEGALRRFQYPGAHKSLSGRIRILLTRVTAWPPFVMGEVATDFPDNEYGIQVLCASCHVPFVDGLLPRRIGKRLYYDGLFWPSHFFVPWRGGMHDYVVQVSATSMPLSDISSPSMPFWWGFIPPSVDILRGLFWLGYRDAARWFSTAPKATPDLCCSWRNSTLDVDNGAHAVADDDGESVARWRAARQLLRRSPVIETPALDPVTGDEVQMLIARALACASRQRQIASLVLVILTPVMIAAVWAVNCK